MGPETAPGRGGTPGNPREPGGAPRPDAASRAPGARRRMARTGSPRPLAHVEARLRLGELRGSAPLARTLLPTLAEERHRAWGEWGPHHRRPPHDALRPGTVGRSRDGECRTFPARPRVAIYPPVPRGGGPATLGGAVRSFVLLALVSTASLAAPSFSNESAGTLGRPDLASSSRVHTLVQLDARRVVAIDGAGLARLWDVSEWQQLGVASPG